MKIIQMPRNVKTHNLDTYAFVLVPLPDDAFQTIFDSLHFKYMSIFKRKKNTIYYYICLNIVDFYDNLMIKYHTCTSYMQANLIYKYH